MNAIDIMHELQDTNTALQRVTAELATCTAELATCTAERARYGDMMTERLGKCENERDAARAQLASVIEDYQSRLVDAFNDTGKAVMERDAARAELFAARGALLKGGLERDAARTEAAALRGALAAMRAYINKYVTLTDTERWLLSTIEAALPSDNSGQDAL